MTDALKELIKTAPIKKSGYFNRFMFVSNGEYDGFWGKNGYDNIIVLGKAADDEKWYRIACEVDVFNVNFHEKPVSVSIDIPKEYGIPNLFFHTPIQINYDGFTSSVLTFID